MHEIQVIISWYHMMRKLFAFLFFSQFCRYSSLEYLQSEETEGDNMMAFIFDSLTILIVFTGFSIAAVFEVFVTCCYNCCCKKHHMQVLEDIYDDYDGETGGDPDNIRPKTNGTDSEGLNHHQIQPTINESNLNSMGHPPTPAQW